MIKTLTKLVVAAAVFIQSIAIAEPRVPTQASAASAPAASAPAKRTEGIAKRIETKLEKERRETQEKLVNLDHSLHKFSAAIRSSEWGQHTLMTWVALISATVGILLPIIGTLMKQGADSLPSFYGIVIGVVMTALNSVATLFESLVGGVENSSKSRELQKALIEDRKNLLTISSSDQLDENTRSKISELANSLQTLEQNMHQKDEKSKYMLIVAGTQAFLLGVGITLTISSDRNRGRIKQNIGFATLLVGWLGNFGRFGFLAMEEQRDVLFKEVETTRRELHRVLYEDLKYPFKPIKSQ